MKYFPLLLFSILFIIARPITVLLHELGHAIPAIILTKEKVIVYIGSYGDPKKSLELRLGKLQIYFNYNLFAWRMGLFTPTVKNITLGSKIFYTITGPLASFSIATLLCFVTFNYDLHGFLKLFLIIFLVSAILDLIVNLIPSEASVELYNGEIVHNDGYQLKQLMHYRRLHKEHNQAIDLYNKKHFIEAATLFNKILIDGKGNEDIYRLAIISYLNAERFDCVEFMSEQLSNAYGLNSYDLLNLGLAYSRSGKHEKAIGFYAESIKKDTNNKLSLANMGYTLYLFHRYDEAIVNFNMAIEIDKYFAYAYSNRGLSKIKNGHSEDGITDILYSLEIDEDESFGYRNLGVYHLDRGEHEKALQLFIKAREIESSTHMIDELINNARQR